MEGSRLVGRPCPNCSARRRGFPLIPWRRVLFLRAFFPEDTDVSVAACPATTTGFDGKACHCRPSSCRHDVAPALASVGRASRRWAADLEPNSSERCRRWCSLFCRAMIAALTSWKWRIISCVRPSEPLLRVRSIRISGRISASAPCTDLRRQQWRAPASRNSAPNVPSPLRPAHSHGGGFLRVREFAVRREPPWQPREACAWVSARPRACLRISTACRTVRPRSHSISTSAWRKECCQSGNSAAQPWRCTVSLSWKPSAVSPSPTQAPGGLAGLLHGRQIVVSPALISDRGAVGSTTGANG